MNATEMMLGEIRMNHIGGARAGQILSVGYDADYAVLVVTAEHATYLWHLDASTTPGRESLIWH